MCARRWHATIPSTSLPGTRPTIVRSALEAARYGHLVRNLVTRDLRLKYKGTSLGFLWSLANPLLMLCVYMLAFDYILDVPVDNFALFFFIGYLVWNFLASTLTASATCIVGNGALLNKVYFPRIVLPLAVVLSNAVQFVLSTACLAPVLYWAGMPVDWQLALFPGLFLLIAIFVVGLAAFVAASHTFYRDTLHLLECALALWFWLTPVVYTLDLVPPRIRPLFLLNPMTSFVTGFRDVALHGTSPALSTWLAMTAWAIVALTVGVSVFVRQSHRFAELV